MKKLIQWLAKVFNANITKEVIVEKEIEKIVYKAKLKSNGGFYVADSLYDYQVF